MGVQIRGRFHLHLHSCLLFCSLSLLFTFCMFYSIFFFSHHIFFLPHHSFPCPVLLHICTIQMMLESPEDPKSMETVIEDLKKALELEPLSAYAMFSLGTAYHRVASIMQSAQMLSMATSTFEEASKKFPTFVDGLVLYAMVCIYVTKLHVIYIYIYVSESAVDSLCGLISRNLCTIGPFMKTLVRVNLKCFNACPRLSITECSGWYGLSAV